MIELQDRWGRRIFTSETARSVKGALLEAHQRGVSLIGVNLKGESLTFANLRGFDLSLANLVDANLSRAELWGTKLVKANAWRANLTGADLYKVNASMAIICDANLNSADFTRANLSGSTLNSSSCVETVFALADMSGADLRGARFPMAKLTFANLTNADFDGADLSSADLYGAVGINPALSNPLHAFKDQPGKIHAYIVVNKRGEGIFDGRKYVIGNTYEAPNANTCENTYYGEGILAYPLDIALKECRKGQRILIAEFGKEDIATIPVRVGKKIRLFRCKIVGERPREGIN